MIIWQKMHKNVIMQFSRISISRIFFHFFEIFPVTYVDGKSPNCKLKCTSNPLESYKHIVKQLNQSYENGKLWQYGKKCTKMSLCNFRVSQFQRIFFHFFEIFPALYSRMSTENPLIVN